MENKKSEFEKDKFTQLFNMAWPELSSFLLNVLPVNINLIDTEGYVAWGNKRMLDTLHLTSLDQFIGKHISEWNEPNEIRWKFCKKVLESGKEITVEESFKDTYYLAIRKPILFDGKIKGVLGISIDITDKKKAEQEIILAKEAAEAASHAKTEFLENMRHDIRTPLSGIVGCAKIIQSQPNDPIRVSEYAEDLVQSSESLLNFLNRILEGIKVATREMPVLKKKFDFKKNIQAIIDLNKSLAAKKNLALTLSIDTKIPAYLIGDPVRLQQIILELVTNALRFTQQGSIDLEIKLKKRETQQDVIEIKVCDTGMGISKDKQEEIFILFTRLTPAHQGIYEGLGLGLAIVKQLVDDLGGEIYVDSQLKQGTIFTCLIPFQEPLVMDDVGLEDLPVSNISVYYKNASNILPFTKRAPKNNCIGQKKILLVEDDKLAAKIAQSILTELNCVIDIAPDAKTALQRIQEQEYHLILTDIGLPDMDGIALTHHIRLQQWQRTDTMPIIGLTAHIDGENRQHCLDAGMNTVILKPLKKTMAVELLKTFVPDTQISSPTEIHPISGAVLDIDAMKVILKNDELIKDCIHLMKIELKKDIAELSRFQQSADWQAIREIAHRRQGGASYCGAKRLEQACKQIDDYLREQGPNGQTNGLYQQLIQEMQTAQTVCEDYLSK
ncbi:ATP-binding protein [Rickettsiella endosymbiont of Xylota segnis]|uniref:ATP-binding protein n=1 Tax=Rickettsiella endosymbiont of Xylota segnis TaxID=3066238 RepID=UPI0030D37A48